MLEPIVPGVSRIRGARGSNVYLAELVDGSLALVDTGFAATASRIATAVDALGDERALRWILLTHSHVDHAGAAMSLRARFAAAVVAGAGDCVDDGGGGLVLYEPLGRSHRSRRLARRVARRAATPGVTIVDCGLRGEVEVAPGILAVPTPGHTPGSYCYVDVARGVAFVGDLVISHPDGLARPLAMTNADDEQYLASLEAFAQRAPDVGCAGHGRPVLRAFREQLCALAASPRRHPLSPFGAPRRALRLARFMRGLRDGG